MKSGLLSKQFVSAFFALFISCILSACGSGTSSSSGSSGNTAAPVALGVLSNGSTLYTSASSFPIGDAGTPVNGVLSLSGGTPASFTISFGGVQNVHANVSSLQNANSNGLIITPSSCVIGSAGSGSSQTCTYSIAASESTPPGTYSVPVMAASLNSSVQDSGDSAQDLGSIVILVSGSVSEGSRSITSYSLNGTTGVINDTNIAVEVPYGTDISSLVATYVTTGASVTVGSTAQVNGTTPNNFTSPVVYTVTAANGLTKNYNVTVTTATASDNAITAFSLNGTAGVITGTNIAVEVPYGTDVTNLVAAFTSSGTSVAVGGTTQTSGTTTNNFTSPVIYTVTAADGSTQNYTVTVTVLAQPWINVGNPGLPMGYADFSAIAFNPATNQPYVFYTNVDDEASYKATVIKFDGTNWVAVGNPLLSAYGTQYNNIAFNPATNQPYIVYQNRRLPYKATVMKFDGNDWVNVGNPEFSAGEVFYTDIAFNPATNEPYVVYRDKANDNKATVMKFDGTNWVNVGNPGFSADDAEYTTIAFNPVTNQPYVVYRDFNKSSKATVMKFDGTNWVNVGTAGFSAGKVVDTFIVFNPSTNQPYVVYRDNGNAGKATVMKFDGTNWVNVGNPGFSADNANNTSIAFNPATNQPYVVYRNDEYKVTVMSFNGIKWDNVGTSGFTGGLGFNTNSIAFNPLTNEPYIVYLNYDENLGKVVVMKF